MWRALCILILATDIKAKPPCNIYTTSCDLSASSSSNYDSSQYPLLSNDQISSETNMRSCICVPAHLCQPDISLLARDLFSGYTCTGTQTCCSINNIISGESSDITTKHNTFKCGVRMAYSGSSGSDSFYSLFDDFPRNSRIQVNNVGIGREPLNPYSLNSGYSDSGYSSSGSISPNSYGASSSSNSRYANYNPSSEYTGYNRGSSSSSNYEYPGSDNKYFHDVSQLARILDEPGGYAEFGEFPWQIAVVARNYTYICGGALVHKNWVVTAAHCVNRLNPYNLLVRLGQRSISGNGDPTYQETKVSHVIMHPKFNKQTLANDIALLQLSSPAQNKNYISPICIPASNTDFTGMRCTVTGWGKNYLYGDYSEHLKKIEVPVIHNSECQSRYRINSALGNNFRLDSSFLCAGEKNRDACKGDGGSPLACYHNGVFVLAGIVSWGIGCGGEYPGVYTRIALFERWINAYINAYNQGDKMADSSFFNSYEYDIPSTSSYVNQNSMPIERDFYEYDSPINNKDLTYTSNTEYNTKNDRLGEKIFIPMSIYKPDGYTDYKNSGSSYSSSSVPSLKY